MVVVDWAAVAYAPPERDLWMLLDEANPEWSSYTATTNIISLSDRALAAYRLYWNLSDIAVFVSWCRCPHDRMAEMEMAWAELQSYVMGVAFSLCSAGRRLPGDAIMASITEATKSGRVVIDQIDGDVLTRIANEARMRPEMHFPQNISSEIFCESLISVWLLTLQLPAFL